jgi:hypothetical protein
MFTRRIPPLAAAILTTLAITGAAAAGAAATPQSHAHIVRAASPAGSTTGTVHILANGPGWK